MFLNYVVKHMKIFLHLLKIFKDRDSRPEAFSPFIAKNKILIDKSDEQSPDP